MRISVHFWSYFADAAGTRRLELELPESSTVADALARIHGRFPALASARSSTLMAVGVDYAEPGQVLRDGDELSFFPPVQGG